MDDFELDFERGHSVAQKIMRPETLDLSEEPSWSTVWNEKTQ